MEKSPHGKSNTFNRPGKTLKSTPLNFGICNLTVIPMRAEPSDKSEMVSQVLFGETFEILSQEKQWLRIHTGADDYEGWIDEKQIVRLESATFRAAQESSYCLTDLTAAAYGKTGSLILVIGSSLPGFEKGRFFINGEEYKTEGDATDTSRKELASRIPWNATKFAGMPYLWGGRSLMGLDCSGFTNIVFKLSGIRLKRDAWQQSEQGMLISFIDNARAGDLAFFQNEEGKVTHVGILLENNKIIHASGRVRIDTIDHFGIYNQELKRYSHQLRLIRRIIE